MARGLYFNNKKMVNPALKNRRDADKLITSSYKAFMLLGLMALRDEFDFGSKRLERFVERMHNLIDSYNQGYISVKDLSDTIFEETGIRIDV